MNTVPYYLPEEVSMDPSAWTTVDTTGYQFITAGDKFYRVKPHTGEAWIHINRNWVLIDEALKEKA